MDSEESEAGERVRTEATATKEELEQALKQAPISQLLDYVKTGQRLDGRPLSAFLLKAIQTEINKRVLIT